MCCAISQMAIVIIIIVSCHRFSFFPGTFHLEPVVNPTTQASSLCVQIGYGARPASCPMGTGVLSTGVKRGRGMTQTTHPHVVPRSWMSTSYTPLPPAPPCACCGTALPFPCLEKTSVFPTNLRIPGLYNNFHKSVSYMRNASAVLPKESWFSCWW
jgi:hypothetical protein